MPSKSMLELRQQVGQLLIMGFDGTTVSTRLRLMLATFCPAGVILFKRNIAEATQIHALLREARKAVSTPMFLCVDMEGGTVDRLRDVIAPVPSVADVAAAGSKKVFRKHGRMLGEEVRALGFNTDFAPALDLRLEASKNVLTSRTVSADPKAVTLYAREFLRGSARCKCSWLRQAFPRTGRSQSRLASWPAVDCEALGTPVERGLASLSRVAQRVTVRHGRACRLSGRDWRPELQRRFRRNG